MPTLAKFAFSFADPTQTTNKKAGLRVGFFIPHSAATNVASALLLRLNAPPKFGVLT